MKVKLLKKKNYLAMIENAAKGENWMFRNLYAEVDGQEKDILEDGRLSCAVVLTSIIYLNRLTDDLSSTVDSAVRKLLASGWYETDELKPGAVLVWEKKAVQPPHGDGKLHSHIGFYVGGEMAVSNSSFNSGVPIKHHYTYNDTRKIEKILWHPELDD